MVFTTDRQRKAVMAKLNNGGSRSDVSPTIIQSPRQRLTKKFFSKEGLTFKEFKQLRGVGASTRTVRNPKTGKTEDLDRISTPCRLGGIPGIGRLRIRSTGESSFKCRIGEASEPTKRLIP